MSNEEIKRLLGDEKDEREAASSEKEDVKRLDELTEEMELLGEAVEVDPELADLVGAVEVSETEFKAL